MKTKLLIILILFTASCKEDASKSFIEKCDRNEEWDLAPFRNENLKFNISLPSNWDTEVDFIKRDTLSVTSIDTVEYLENDRLRIAMILHYKTSIDIDRNFEVIKESLKPFSESGPITVNNYDGRYLISDVVMGQDTLTSFLALFQNQDRAINIISQVTKGSGDKERICDFRQILSTLEMN